MIRLGKNIGIIGIETDFQPCYKTLTSNAVIAEGSFCGFPQDYSYIENGIENYIYEPWLISKEILFVGIQDLTLSPNKSYLITGYAGIGSQEVFLTINPLDGEDFTQRYSYSTKTDEGFYSFGLTNNELLFEEETKICLWTLNANYRELKNFNAVLGSQEVESRLVVSKVAVPIKEETSGSVLDVQGTISEAGPEVHSVFIYDEADLPEEAVQQQRIIQDGFLKISEGETLESKKQIQLFEALGHRSEGRTTVPADASSYKFIAAQKNLESDFQPIQLYVWSEGAQNGTVDVTNMTWSKVCLSGDTKILMADGTQKCLEELSPGEMVTDINGGATRILDIKRGVYSPFYMAYEFENNVVINETSRHRFYNLEDGYHKNLQDWNIGEHAINSQNEKVALLSKKLIKKKIENFGLVTESGRYYANSLLSGLMRCNKDLIKEKDINRLVKIIDSLSFSEGLNLVGETAL